MTFTEADLATVARIQELRGNTLDAAKKVYKRELLKLANPDIENRAALILGSIERATTKPTEDFPATVTAPKKMTRNERRLAAKEKKAQKAKEKKTKKAAVAVVEVSLPKLEREVELTESAAKHVYTTNLFGKKHAVLWTEVDHQKEGAAARFGPVPVSERRMDALKDFAKNEQLPTAICVTVRVSGRLDQGYAVPFDTYKKYQGGSKNAFTLSAVARKEYADEGWVGCKFSEAKSNQKAA